MKKRMFVLGLVLAGCSPAIFAQSNPEAPETASIVVKVAKLLDVRKGRYLENVAIWIEGERIKEVGPVSDCSRMRRGTSKLSISGALPFSLASSTATLTSWLVSRMAPTAT